MVQGEYGDQLVIAHHHENDVFEIPWVVERSDLYGAGVIPHVRIDGKFAIRGAQNCASAAADYRAAIERRLAETGGLSPIGIAGSYWIGEDQVSVAATFTLQDPAELVDTRAFLLMLVDDLYWAGTSYDQVTQGAWEQEITLLAPGDRATVEAHFACDPAWHVDDIRCLAFAQRLSDSLEVHQAALLTRLTSSVSHPDLAVAAGVRIAVGPNPARLAAGPIDLRLQGLSGRPDEDVAVLVLDAQGRRTRRLPARAGRDGCWIATWDGRDERGARVSPGAYWLRAPGAGQPAPGRLVVLR